MAFSVVVLCVQGSNSVSALYYDILTPSLAIQLINGVRLVLMKHYRLQRQ
jgi:hypothetical protein